MTYTPTPEDAARIERHVAEVVAAAPPPSPELAARLAALLPRPTDQQKEAGAA